ncbi:MAG: DNA-3-methyladenine glycosylase family protein [Thermoleophilaceae bacterium]
MPIGPFRMPRGGRDGVMRQRDGVLRRVITVGADPVVVAAWPCGGAVRFRAEARTREAAHRANDRMRFALGVDHDLSDFHRRFWRHDLLGPVLRSRPWLRPMRRPEPFEALAWAVCEQLIDGPRAAAVERRLVFGHGPTCPDGELRDVPGPGVIAGLSPAEIERCGLAPSRAISLIKAAHEVECGRVDLHDPDSHEHGWRRLRTIRGIGSWTTEYLALHGQGRDDQLPCGDLAYIKLVGLLAHLGRRATEDEVREYFEPYAPFAGPAGCVLAHAMAGGAYGPPPGVRPRQGRVRHAAYH